VIVDRLVSDEILGVIKGEIKIAKKYPGCAEQAQKEIYEWCKQGLREGRHVIRLKIGKKSLDVLTFSKNMLTKRCNKSQFHHFR